ncbi:MAG: indolepyruvate ferredoxin oxidoreductase alpha subunit [Candidatus Hecatellales archaeon B24]|nr:MAG: indolepyruvate ferredoxin oxidoreductase alpha subunit [Candidatus Hecatellales archaeon B24]
MIRDVVKDVEGENVLLLGNEAMARGALEAGIDVYAAYPGTPSSEIADTLSEACRLLKGRTEFYMEYSINEKVAFEVAAGASLAGKRGMCGMKHVGVNVASDTLFSFAYVGARGGFVVVSADDPSLHSSQNEQDNRWYGRAARVPIVEASNVQEAKDLVKLAFNLSEEFQLPIMFRSYTRLSHTSGVVKLGKLPEKKLERVEWERSPLSDVLVPANAIKRKKVLLEKIERVRRRFDGVEINRVEGGEGREGVIACGISYTYAKEALGRIGVDLPVLKLLTQYPLPEKLIENFISSLDKVAVVEELDPFVELHVKAIAKDYGVKVYGKENGCFPESYEYNISIVERGLAKMLGKGGGGSDELLEKVNTISSIAPPRPPVFCPGCPHAATFYAIKKVSKDVGGAALPSDIGCYTLGVSKPFETVEICICMGAGVGVSNGLSKVLKNKIITTVGDSTFFHATVPAMINAVYNRHRFVFVVLDNSGTAMTGFQPHPGLPVRGCGEQSKPVKIEDVAKGCGVEFVEVVNPYNIRKMEDTLRRALEHEAVSVIVARRLCAVLWNRERRRKGIKIVPFKVEDGCDLCLECVSSFTCPAIVYDGKKVWIDEALCAGCGVCAQICPRGVIKPKTEG